MKSYFTSLIFALLWVSAQGQTAISLKGVVAGITNDAQQGGVAYMPGAILAVEQFLGSPNAGLKLSQAGVQTPLGEWVYASQFSFKLRFYQRKHALSIGAGPMIFWSKTPPLISEEWFSKGKWYGKLNWLGAELEYSYYLNPKWKFVVSLNTLAPKTGNLALGLAYWPAYHARKSCDCPSFGHR